MSHQQPRSILKHNTSTHPQNGHIVWDEDNLQQNDAEKVPRMKIDEPKTPYHAPSDYNELDMDPLDLGGSNNGIHMDFDTSHIDNNRGLFPSSSDDEEDPYAGMNDEEINEAKRKHEEFAKMRKNHYHMQGVLRRASQDQYDPTNSDGDDTPSYTESDDE